MKIKDNKIYKLKNNIFTVINYIAVIICLFSICLFDSDTFIPMIAFAVSTIYLIIVAASNGWLDDLMG